MYERKGECLSCNKVYSGQVFLFLVGKRHQRSYMELNGIMVNRRPALRYLHSNLRGSFKNKAVSCLKVHGLY